MKKLFSKIKSLFDADKKSLALWFVLDFLFIGVWLAIDLLTKEFVYGPMAAGGPDIVIWKGVLRLTPVENTGASFGIFQGKTDILTIISLVTVVVMVAVMIFSIKLRNGWYRSAMILLIAGGLGNIIDRLLLGYVRDWIYFELIDFAVFNLADTGLTVGCVLLIIFVIFFYKPTENKKKE
ncbi:MAG: signal peptidase II [Clostridia bacterium]|nr:signal peptidase II [Clostridia bacterium]